MREREGDRYMLLCSLSSRGGKCRPSWHVELLGALWSRDLGDFGANSPLCPQKIRVVFVRALNELPGLTCTEVRRLAMLLA